MEPGETEQEALVRECREELDITVSVGEMFLEMWRNYPDIQIHLTLFHCTIAAGTPRLLEHKDLKWIRVSEIENMCFARQMR